MQSVDQYDFAPKTADTGLRFIALSDGRVTGLA
jgi:hypothetical protein